MAEGTISRVWNAFRNKEPIKEEIGYEEVRVTYKPDRPRYTSGNGRSIVSSIYTRLAIDVSSTKIQHVDVDENERFLSVRTSGLNECLNVSANLDQTGTDFLRDAAMTLFDKGTIAIVPVETTSDPTNSDAWDVKSLRVGVIKEWSASRVLVDLYNERTAKHEDIWLYKRQIGIVENPFYAVMNEPNSTLKRLVQKLNLLDTVDNLSSSGKLDMIITLPYLVKGERKQAEAAKRVNDIKEQLTTSDLGIAYTDATEKITQLNRPIENKLMPQVEYLTSTLYGQLGLTTGIMDGTADEATMLNYYKRTIKVITQAIVDEMYRKFISKTARTKGQRLQVYNDPFMLVPMSSLADIADKFTRNEVLSSNEMRSIIGFKPDKNARSDELVNKNMPIQDISGGVPADPNSQPINVLETPLPSTEGGI